MTLSTNSSLLGIYLLTENEALCESVVAVLSVLPIKIRRIVPKALGSVEREDGAASLVLLDPQSGGALLAAHSGVLGGTECLILPPDLELLVEQVEAALRRLQEAGKREALERSLAAANRRIEEILHEVLPDSVADRVQAGEDVIAEVFPASSVVFLDLEDFTGLTTRLNPDRVVHMLNVLFGRFGELCRTHGVERVKSVGDGFLACVRDDVSPATAALRATRFALEAIAVTARTSEELSFPIGIRGGVSTGSFMGGVIGSSHYTYDIWGDAVNLAFRLQESGGAGVLQIDGATFEALGTQLRESSRHEVTLKGQGCLPVWRVIPGALSL